MKKRVVVLGAGLSGLASALELSQEDFSVTVLEKKSYVGGLAATHNWGRHLFDTGPHRWFTKNDEVDQWMRQLMKGRLLKVPRLTHIYFQGKYIEYPLKLIDALKKVGPILGTKAFFDYLKESFKKKLFPQKILTMEDAYINQFGQTLYRLFFEKYNQKLWGLKAKTLSADWVAQRSRGFSISTVIRNMLFPQKIVSFTRAFSFPKKGIGEISQRLHKEIEKRGGKILLEVEPKELEIGKKELRLGFFQKGRRGKIKADFLISSVPLDELVLMIKPTLAKDVVSSARKLRYRDGVFVALFVKKEKVISSNWIYVQDPKIGFVRFSDTANFSHFMNPSGTDSLVFEYACDYGDRTWKKTDEEMISWTKRDFIREFGGIKEKDILAGRVVRMRKTYPIYTLGYQDYLKKIKDCLYSYPVLYLIGRNGMFRYNNMDHAVLTGLLAAKNIVAGKNIYDLEAVNIEKDYHEEKKISC